MEDTALSSVDIITVNNSLTMNASYDHFDHTKSGDMPDHIVFFRLSDIHTIILLTITITFIRYVCIHPLVIRWANTHLQLPPETTTPIPSFVATKLSQLIRDVTKKNPSYAASQSSQSLSLPSSACVTPPMPLPISACAPPPLESALPASACATPPSSATSLLHCSITTHPSWPLTVSALIKDTESIRASKYPKHAVITESDLTKWTQCIESYTYRKNTMSKFLFCVSTLLANTFTISFAIYCFYDQYIWFVEHFYSTELHPEMVTRKIMDFYLFSIAYYLHLCVALYIDHKSSSKTNTRFLLLCFHHIVTLALLVIAVLRYYAHAGIFILIIHEIPETILQLANLTKHLQYLSLSTALFVFYCIAFSIFRVYVLDVIVLYGGAAATKQRDTAYWSGFVVLMSLAVLQMYWWLKICQFVWRGPITDYLNSRKQKHSKSTKAD